MKITKLPSGEAEGARDLQSWAVRRNMPKRDPRYRGVPRTKRGKEAKMGNKSLFKHRVWDKQRELERYGGNRLRQQVPTGPNKAQLRSEVEVLVKEWRECNASNTPVEVGEDPPWD